MEKYSYLLYRMLTSFYYYNNESQLPTGSEYTYTHKPGGMDGISSGFGLASSWDLPNSYNDIFIFNLFHSAELLEPQSFVTTLNHWRTLSLTCQLNTIHTVDTANRSNNGHKLSMCKNCTYMCS